VAGISARPLAYSAAERIGRRIVTGDFRPGSVLPNLNQLAQEFSVSRLSVREAIKLLSGKGLVDSRPRRGTVVRPRHEWSRLDPDVLIWQLGNIPNAGFVRSLFEARRIIEPEAAALAAERAHGEVLAEIERALSWMANTDPTSPESITADVALHQAILAGSGNEFLAAFAPAIATSLTAAFSIQRDARPPLSAFLPDHAAIVEAIKRGDKEGARAAFLKLLRQAESDAVNGLKVRRQPSKAEPQQ